MADTKTVTKAKIVLQDLELGEGKTTQVRNGKSVNVDRIALPFIVTSLSAVRGFPVTAGYVTLRTGSSVKEYYYDSASTAEVDDNAVVKPDSAPGRWLLIARGGGDAPVDTVALQVSWVDQDQHLTFNIAKIGPICVCTFAPHDTDFDIGAFPSSGLNIGEPQTFYTSADLPEAYRPTHGVAVPLAVLPYNSTYARPRIAGLIHILPDGRFAFSHTGSSTDGGTAEHAIPNINKTAGSYNADPEGFKSHSVSWYIYE